MLQTPRGCLFVSNIEKGGRGEGATFHQWREENSHQRKKGRSLKHFSSFSMFRTNLFSTISILHQYQIVIGRNGAKFKETSGGGQRKAKKRKKCEVRWRSECVAVAPVFTSNFHIPAKRKIGPQCILVWDFSDLNVDE